MFSKNFTYLGVVLDSELAKYKTEKNLGLRNHELHQTSNPFFTG